MNPKILHDAVARQHALFVELLPEPVRSYSINSYLIFRLIDTLEDNPSSIEARTELLSRIDKDWLEGLNEAAQYISNLKEVEPEYRELAENWKVVEAQYSSFRPEVQAAIRNTGRYMARGMESFLGSFMHAEENGNKRFISDFSELERYCHVVAGCVGEMNETFFLLERARTDRESGCTELGVYLQLVNIVRDHAKDLKTNRKSYFPASIEELSAEQQLLEVVRFARGKEARIQRYLSVLRNGPYQSYCRTLFRIARLHFEFYEATPEILQKKSSPSSFKLFRILPFRLKIRFLLYKIGRLLAGTRQK